MNSTVKNQDRFIYYDAYKHFVHDLEKFYYTFSIDKNLLIKIKLEEKKQNFYPVTAVDLDVDLMLDETMTSYEEKEKLRQIHNFEIKPENLSTIHIEDLTLSKKMLNNKLFRKRIHCLIKDRLDSILRKF